MRDNEVKEGWNEGQGSEGGMRDKEVREGCNEGQ